MIKNLFFSVLFLNCCVFLKSQSLLNYNVTRNTGVTYSSINSTGASFNSWRNITSFTQDDNRSAFTDIGFDFWYNGTRYTQFCVSTNGFIDFSNSTDDGGPTADDFGYDNTAFTNANIASATRPAIAPFYDDLTAQGGTEALGNSIKYLVTGTAPNRTLTIEWINMAVYLNTTPSLNFQVKLVETTGQILINYGVMNTGTKVFSYGMGLNSATLTAPPTAAQLKMLQTVNSNVFSNTVQNNLSGMPAANSQYIFTPPVPTPTAGSLSFTGISQSGMTLNWTNWATNETGYVIYNSTDGINYSFVSQTAANAISAAVTGLLPGTTYYWKLYAVTDGCLSSAITGTQATSAGGVKTSMVSGNWGSATTWTPAGIPTAGDNVTIANGHNVTINANAQCNLLTIGQGGAASLQFGTTTARSLTVNSNVVVNSGASFSVAVSSNVTHSLVVKGDITNNGILDFASDANSLCNSTFQKNGNQTISGSGTITRFNLITQNMGNTANNTLDVASTNFTVPVNFLTLTNGTFKLSTINAVNITPFSALTTISQNGGLWLNSNTGIINTGAGITLSGKVTVSGGTLNIGDAANEDLLSSGGTLSVTAGVTNIAGKYYASGINNLCYFSISGGTVTIPTFGSTNTTIAPFQIIGAGSKFDMSGGYLQIIREGGSGAQDLGFTNTVPGGIQTGGTLQIGSTATPASQTININTSVPVGNLLVNSSNATARLITNSLTVTKDIVIATGTLNANNLGISLGGNWINNGGLFTPGTGTVNFNSGTAQYLLKSGGETFNHLLFTGSGVKTFSSAITSNGNFSVSSGSSVDVSSLNNQLTVKGNFVNNGTFTTRTGLVAFTGTVAQTIGGSSVTDFYDMTLGNPAGASLSSAENLRGTLTLTTGVLNTNSQVFTMVSTATATARIAEITGSGDITGNVTVQRFVPGGTTGWCFIGTPLSSALTLNDWDDDIYISCPTCPDGSAGGFLSIYTYDETKSGFYDDYLSYIPLSTINDPIQAGKGYWVYSGTGQFTSADITMDVTGAVRKFNYTIPLNYTNYGSAVDDGWNLIHNPYPSPVSWSALKGTTANIDDAIYVWNTDLNGGTGGFASYVNGVSSPAVGSGGVGNTIPMWQGFYVHSTGATALNALESNKVAGNPTFLKQNSAAASSGPLLRLNLKNNVFNDETVLYLQAGANDIFDKDYDSYKMRGQDPNAPSIALEKGNKVFQINGVAPINGNFTMPLKTLTGYPGTYTISATNFSTFPNGACINLYDKFTGLTTNLKTSSYVFTLSDTTTVARFNLNITINPLNINSNINQPTCISPTNGQIIAVGANSGPWNYYWTSNGSLVKTSLNKATADTLYNLSNGNYELEMNSVGMCDNNNSNYQVIGLFVPSASFQSVDTLDLNQSLSVTFTNTSQDAILYFWEFGDGIGTSTNAQPVYYYTSPGTYKVKMISWSVSNCADTASKYITVIGNAVGLNASSLTEASLLVKTLSNNEFVIQQRFTQPQTITFKLLDLSGRIIADYGTITSDTIDLPLDLKSFPAGIYFLNMTSGNENKIIKLPVR